MITILILFLTFVLIIFQFRNNIRKWKKLPPGPLVKWPILGNIIEMNLADPNYPHKALAKMSKKYGPIMSLGFGVHSAVVVSSFDAMKELFKRDELSSSRFEFPYVKGRSFNKNLGVIWSTGLVWRDMRRFTLRNLREFGFGKLKPMEVILREETNEIASYILTSTQENNGILKVDLHTFAASAINILWSLVGGYRFQHDDKKLHQNLELNNQLSEIFGPKNIYNVFPFLKTWFPKWSQYERHIQINQEIQQFIKEQIEEIKIKISYRPTSTPPDSFIEVFLEEIKKNSSDPKTIFTEEQLIVILMDLFFAGSETTSITLNWSILFLTLNPRVQRKVQQEIFKILAESETKAISLKDFSRMPYMKATLLEIFRISNFVPMPAPRMPTDDIKFENYVIPKGTCMFMNLTPLFSDEAYWGPDVKTFRPERFLNKAEDTIDTERAEKISVFGFGKRVCLAESMAMDSIFMYLTTLLKNFTFKPAPGVEKPSAEKPNFALVLYPREYSVQVSQNTELFN